MAHVINGNPRIHDIRYGQQRTLPDVIRQYMEARTKNGRVSTLDAANTISKVLPVNYLSAEEFDEMIALVAIDYGLAVEFDRCNGSAEPSVSQTATTSLRRTTHSTRK